MEFGRVDNKELKKIDFSLPKEPASNKLVLKGKKAADLPGLSKMG